MRLTIIPSRHTRKLENGMYETQMKDSIIINYTPSGEYDLINKGLADHYIDRIDLNRLETIFSKDLFPDYNGHFDKIDNEFYFNHISKGVTNDAYMTIDKRGLVTTSQRKMPANFINEFGFDKIIRTSFPNVVEGLGITNATNLEGRGVVKGGVMYKEAHGRGDAPLTSKTTRDFLNSKNMYQIGDIVMVRSDVDMSNTSWLKLDGSQKEVSSYTKLFSHLGPAYGLYLNSRHHGQPWKNTVNLGSNAGARPDTVIETEAVYYPEFHNLGGAAIFSTKDRIYVCGGYRGDRNKPLSSVYVCFLNTQGKISYIERGPDLPEPRVFSRALGFCDHIHLIGGSPSPNKQIGGSRIIRAVIKNDGSIGPWFFGEAVPYEYSRSMPYLSGDRLYIIGGVEFGGKDNNKTIERNITTRSWCFINLDGSLRLPWKFDENPNYESHDSNYYKDWGGTNSLTTTIIKPRKDNVNLLSISNNINNRSVTHWISNIVGLKNVYSFPSVYVKMARYGVKYSVFGVDGGLSENYGSGKSFLIAKTNNQYGVEMNFESGTIMQIKNDGVFRSYHDGVQTNYGALFIGGVSNLDPSINTESSISPKCVYVKTGTGFQNYIEYMKLDKNPTMFNLPLVDDIPFNGTPYSYYIKAK